MADLAGGGALARSNGALSEMNVVPLVDVVLVLLIIFMLTAHVMDYGLEVNVPKVKVTKENTEHAADGGYHQRNQTLHLNDKEVNIHDLHARLGQAIQRSKRLFTWRRTGRLAGNFSRR